MRIALRRDLKQGVSEGIQRNCFSSNPGLFRRIFLPRQRPALGTNCYFGEIDKHLQPFPAIELVGDSPMETPRKEGPQFMFGGAILGLQSPGFLHDHWGLLAQI